MQQARAIGLDPALALVAARIGTDAKDPREDRCVNLGGRGARLARREEEEYSTYCDDEQRRQPGWIGRPDSHRYLRAGPKLALADSVVPATARRSCATLSTQDADFEGLPDVKFRARKTTDRPGQPVLYGVQVPVVQGGQSVPLLLEETQSRETTTGEPPVQVMVAVLAVGLMT